jgi:hypothetical protein
LSSARTERTLVCILAKTRAADVTFPAFERHVLRELDADLAVALTLDAGYDQDNPYLQRARYRWIAPDPQDYGQLFDEAQAELCRERGLAAPRWRDLLAFGGTWAGRIRSAYAHPSATAVLIYSRWLLLRNLQREGLLDRYDRFVITRSDFQWLCPHPPWSVLAPENVWVPADHHWSGINDRHMVVRSIDVEPCLNLLEEILLRPAELAQAMSERTEWNDEQLLALQLRRRGLAAQVREFPYVMYLVRSPRDRSATWSAGRYDPWAGHFVKYESEFRSARAMSGVVRNRVDWEQGAWRSLDTSRWMPPDNGAAHRLLDRAKTVTAVTKDRLLRPDLPARLHEAITARFAGKKAAAEALPAVGIEDYDALARKRGW